MYSPKPDAEFIEGKLYELRNAHPVAAGLMLVSTGGLLLASTFEKEDNATRLAAVSRTLYLLAEDTCTEFDRGALQSVHLRFRRGGAGDDNTPTRVVLRPVTEETLLVIVLNIPAQARRQDAIFEADIVRMITYLAHHITHAGSR